MSNWAIRFFAGMRCVRHRSLTVLGYSLRWAFLPENTRHRENDAEESSAAYRNRAREANAV